MKNKPRYEDSLAVKRPDLAAEWCFEKNEGMTPEDVSPGLNLKVYWKCKVTSHSPWEARIFRRTYGQGCPRCPRRPPYEKSFAFVRPDLVSEWHPTLNEELTPADVYANSNTKYWWLCSAETSHDPWLATPAKRNNDRGCPTCSGSRTTPTYNLAVLFPDLLKEWHYELNIGIDPYKIHPKSGQKVWWKCSKDDSHEPWEAVVASRANGVGCPRCGGKIITSERSLAFVYPELAKEWHPTKNTMNPDEVFAVSNNKAWWICLKDPNHPSWEAKIANRVKGDGCPYCSGHRLSDDNRLSKICPDLVNEWHPLKNGSLTPDDVSFGTRSKVWWQCKANPSHEWKASVANRSKGRGCPHCKQSSLEIRVYTELKTVFPDAMIREQVNNQECDVFIPSIRFAIEIDGCDWHINRIEKDKNKNRILNKANVFLLRIRDNGLPLINEYDIQYNIDKKDEKTDLGLLKKIFAIAQEKCLDSTANSQIADYLQRDTLANNSEYATLLYCAVLPGRSLLEKHPEVAKEWHPTKNLKLGPEHVTHSSGRKAWWQCSIDPSHEWEAYIANRSKGHGCPYCTNQKPTESNNLAVRYPDLVSEWHYPLNELKPEDFLPNSSRKVWWKCKDPTHLPWEAVIYSRTAGNNCPYCSGRKVCDSNSLATLDPEIAKEWHLSLNGDKTPNDFTVSSSFYAWWQCLKNKDHSWYSKIANRHVFRGKCPHCRKEDGNID